jgi:ATP-dependent Clp protease ATP-binding subunit ClpA
MLVFSQNLSQSLSRAIAQAERQSYQCATPEHVLLALLDDPDAVPVMRACNVDLEKLRSAVLASMPHWPYMQDEDGPYDALDSDEPDETPDPEEPDDARTRRRGFRSSTSRSFLGAPSITRSRAAAKRSTAQMSWWRCWNDPSAIS